MLLNPRYAITAIVILIVLAGSTYWLYPNIRIMQQTKQAENERKEDPAAPTKSISIVNMDFTVSDSTFRQEQNPYRVFFTDIVRDNLNSSYDILAAYLIHNGSINNQPFYTTHSVMNNDEKRRPINDLVEVKIHQDLCLAEFDSIASKYLMQDFSTEDSTLVLYTDIVGTLQNAALYFRRYANKQDHKKIFYLSDMHQTANTSPVVNTTHIPSKEIASELADEIYNNLQKVSDVTDELEGAEIYILTPNEVLNSQKYRNYSRMLWEKLFQEKLQCKSIYFY